MRERNELRPIYVVFVFLRLFPADFGKDGLLRNIKYKFQVLCFVMLRRYGMSPYHLVLLHGGPGAI